MVKQVIVFRHDLLKGDHALRKGKIAAQVAHASLGSLLQFFRKIECIDQHGNHTWKYETEFGDGSYMDEWLNGSFTKIVVSAPDEAALREIKAKCDELDIPCSLITDAGNTEFHGVPTVTCLGIGPYDSDTINKITGNLSLL